ncbi:retinoschisin-like [Pocillopora verrucosa]|uniref:retinoschisin-like n=1 Tax=Pocillopora verrucosa TaxID=203993 RepID=UPI003341DA18
MVDGHALLDHVFATVSVTRVIDCFSACQTNCRCISFNFLTHSNQDNCQLNEENRHLKPGALIPMEGSQYYDLDIIYHTEACTQCFKRCCRAQPCFNGGTCRENCHVTGRRFLCNCPARFIGNVCEKDCQDALGLESGDISDAQLSASTELVPEKGAKHGRLQSKWNGVSGGGWIPNISDTNQWLQIDLLDQHSYVVTKIATQGRNYYSHIVTKYKLQYSDDGVTFLYYREEGQVTDKVFPGNTDRDTVVSHELIPPIRARYIRFRPIEWSDYIGMRVELYGCRDN